MKTFEEFKKDFNYQARLRNINLDSDMPVINLLLEFQYTSLIQLHNELNPNDPLPLLWY